MGIFLFFFFFIASCRNSAEGSENGKVQQACGSLSMPILVIIRKNHQVEPIQSAFLYVPHFSYLPKPALASPDKPAANPLVQSFPSVWERRAFRTLTSASYRLETSERHTEDNPSNSSQQPRCRNRIAAYDGSPHSRRSGRRRGSGSRRGRCHHGAFAHRHGHHAACVGRSGCSGYARQADIGGEGCCETSYVCAVRRQRCSGAGDEV